MVLALAVLCAVVFAVPAMAARSKTVSAKLTGTQEVPPVFTKGHGTAEIELMPDEMLICFELKVSRLTSESQEAHIHKAPRGMNGEIVAILVPPNPPEDGESSGCTPAQPNVIRSMSKHPERYYVNIHTVQRPDGEIRGQLEKGPLHK